MENPNIHPFYVGQKVVCIKSNPTGTLKENKVYEIKAMRNCPMCNASEVNVGFISDRKLINCGCGFTEINQGFYWASRFRPLQEAKFKAVSFEKIIEEVEQLCEN